MPVCFILLEWRRISVAHAAGRRAILHTAAVVCAPIPVAVLTSLSIWGYKKASLSAVRIALCLFAVCLSDKKERDERPRNERERVGFDCPTKA